ncbi:MAG: MBOAT family protein [Gemmataceae bacterium]|nr:MBOAT family protein [Gemmataceae bacterium]
MIFLSTWFLLLFAPCFLGLYWLPWGHGVRKWLLLGGNLVFHAHFAGPAGVAPIALLGGLTFALALSRRPGWCRTGIAINVAALVFYKYVRFFCEELLGSLHSSWGETVLKTTQTWFPGDPPLAISFFTFEFIHYLVEVGRGAQPIRSPLDFALFATFWPALVAGPVKRYGQFLPALELGTRQVGACDVAAGLARFAIGIVKKAVIADNLAAWVQFMDQRLEAYPLWERWLVFLGIGWRIFMDFSGYSDLAIGLARMLGVTLPENFCRPYLAWSLDEFWRRWHVSLTGWIRDYVYIPLGGSRLGLGRRIVNGWIAFALCGLWHGAAWNFVLWGLYHGAGLGLTSALRCLLDRVGWRRKAHAIWWRPLGWATTMFFVGVGWLLFFYPLPQAWRMLCLLFVNGEAV